MSGQTIRDVVIKVSLENGNLKLGSIDTSGITSSFASAVREMRSALAGMQGGVRSGGSPTGGGSSSSSSSGINKEERDQIRMFGRLMKDREKAKREAEKALEDQAVAAERAYDRETAAAVRSYGKIMDERQKAAKEQQRLRQQVSDNDIAHEVKRQKAAHAAARGGGGNLGEKAGGLFDLGSGMAMTMAGQSGNVEQMAQLMMTIKGFQSIASGAAKTAGAFSKELALVGVSGAVAGVALAAIVVGVIAINQALSELHTVSQKYWKDIGDDAERAEKRLTASAHRHYAQQSSVIANMENPERPERRQIRFLNQQGYEQIIRTAESGDLRSDFKADFRQRQERISEWVSGDNDRFSEGKFQRSKLAKLKSAQSDLAVDEKNAIAARDQGLKQKQKAIDETLKESNLGWAGRQGNRLLGLIPMMGVNTVGDKSGFSNRQMAAHDAAEIDKKEFEKSSAGDIVGIRETLNASLQEEKSIKEKIAELDQQRLTTTREIQQSAYQSVQNEKERVKNVKESFGGAGVKAQNIAMQLQAKHEKIVQQQNANVAAGRPKNQGVEQYSSWQLEQNALGGIAGITMREQRRERADQRGLKPETDLPQKETELAELMKHPLAELDKTASQSAQAAKEIAQKIVKAIEDTFKPQDLLANLDEELAAMKKRFEDNGFKRGSWFSR